MRFILSLIVTIFISTSVIAQDQPGKPENHGNRRERFDHRNGPGNPEQHDFSPEEYWKNLQDFVTREANLTETEAAGFYPLLGKMLEEQRKNNSRSKEVFKNLHGKELSESEYGDAVKLLCGIEVENKRIEEEYYTRFHDVMSWEKVLKVRRALFRYNREALRNFNPRKR